MADVFISYVFDHRKNVVDAIYDRLLQLGLRPWLAERDLSEKTRNRIIKTSEAGVALPNELRNVASNAMVVLVLWSTKSTDSDWVLSEARIGKNEGKLVPLIIDELTPEQIPMPFDNIPTPSISHWDLKGSHYAWNETLRRIGGIVGRPKLADLSELLVSNDASIEAKERWARSAVSDPFAEAVWTESHAVRTKIYEARIEELEKKVKNHIIRLRDLVDSKKNDMQIQMNNSLSLLKEESTVSIPDPVDIWRHADIKEFRNYYRKIRNIPNFRQPSELRELFDYKEKTKNLVTELQSDNEKKGAEISRLESRYNKCQKELSSYKMEIESYESEKDIQNKKIIKLEEKISKTNIYRAILNVCEFTLKFVIATLFIGVVILIVINRNGL